MKYCPWSILQIEPTQNQREIKKAYARLLKTIDQKENPRAFQTLREAYDIALRYSQSAINPEPTVHTGDFVVTEIPEPVQDSDTTETEQAEEEAAITAHDFETTDTEHPEEEGAATEPQTQTARFLSLIETALIEHDEKTAIAELKNIIESEDLQSIDARYEFEGELLLLVNYLDYLPIEFARFLISAFSWESHNNPFSYDQRYSHAYQYFMTEVKRYEAREYVQLHYFNPKPIAFKEIEEVLFAGFNEKNLERISEKPQLRLGAERLLTFTLNQRYSYEINPIDHRTIIWWNENVTQLYEQPAPTKTTNSSGNTSWVFFVLFIMAFPAIRTCTSQTSYNKPPTEISNDYYKRYYQSRGLDPRVDPRLQSRTKTRERTTSEPDTNKATDLNKQLETFLRQRQYLSKPRNAKEKISNEPNANSGEPLFKRPASKILAPEKTGSPSKYEPSGEL